MCPTAVFRMKYNSESTKFRRTLGALSFTTVLLVALSAITYGQGRYDPYYFGRSHRAQEEWTEKTHQKNEKRALQGHQREERAYYGNNAAIRAHQRQERNELKYHQRRENDRLRRHEQHERNGYYRDGRYYDYRNNRYYWNDPFRNRRY